MILLIALPVVGCCDRLSGYGAQYTRSTLKPSKFLKPVHSRFAL
jgi:hypothetical protein